MTFYILLGLCSFLISLLGTRATLETLRKRPPPADLAVLRGEKRPPVPGGGGFAVVFALIISLLIADVHYFVVLAIFILAATALLDSLIAIPAFIRLLVEVLAVSIALSAVHAPLFDGALPTFTDKVITGALWVGLINIFRVMDGIDGLSATEMICIGLGFCVVIVLNNDFPSSLFSYNLALGAAGCGFLWWNWYPAKIRLGDVGNIPIGFLTGYLLLMAIHQGYVYPALILPAYYISDGTVTVLRRIHLGKKLWETHGDYYYQLVARKLKKHDAVARYVFGVNLLLALLAVMAELNPNLGIFCLALAYMAVFMILGFFAHGGMHSPHEAA